MGCADCDRLGCIASDQSAELADARLMLRAMDEHLVHSWSYDGEITPGMWEWWRCDVTGAASLFARVPRTGDTPEINDEVRAAMLADVGGE